MLVIVGCGNPNRSDDGVGVFVARELARFAASLTPARQVRVFDAGTGGMEVMFRARGASALVVVDAVTSGSEPGAVFEVPGEELAVSEPTPNLHAFRFDHALFVGKKIFGDAFPSDVRVFLVEAASTALGLELGAPVARAAAIVVERLQARILAAPPEAPTDEAISVRRGALHFGPAQVARWFGAAGGVALLYRNDLLYVLPLVEPTAGGLLLKLRSPAGDRVVEAQEFFRKSGLDDWAETSCTASWDDGVGGLSIQVPKHLRLEARAC